MKKIVLSLLLFCYSVIMVSAQESKSGYNFRWGAAVRQDDYSGFSLTSVNAKIGFWSEKENHYFGLITGYGYGTSSYGYMNVIPLLADFSHTFFLSKKESFGIITGTEFGALYTIKHLTYNRNSVDWECYVGLKLGLDFKIKQHDLQFLGHADMSGYGLSIGLML